MPSGTRKSSPAIEAGGPLPDEGGILRHLRECLRALGVTPPVALAVSGGGDSMALARLFAEAAPGLDLSPEEIHAVTVDHGLRPEAAREAETVGEWMRTLGFSHDILVWRSAAPGPNLQAAARHARYGLLVHWCARRGVRTLLTAHTADDQAETVLMRLARGSGVDGLSGMAPVRVMEAVDGTRVRLLRPLLDVPRADLRACLEARGVTWFDDPSNENPAFGRVRARHALALLQPLGLSRERLVKTAAQMARARAALEEAVDAAERQSVTAHPAGFRWLDPSVFARVPGEVALRLLARVLMSVSGASYRPRLERLERALAALKGGLARARTVGGCRLVPERSGRSGRSGRVLVCREHRAAQAPVSVTPGSIVIWDGRFRARLAAGVEGGEIGPLGTTGLSRLRGLEGFDASDVPSPVRSTLPAFFRAGEALAAPHLGIGLAGLEIEHLEPAGDRLLRFPPPDATPADYKGWFSDGGTLF
ncbi:MAG: tRNA lysidine(34) synthetase TilS [Alphaproteobacteria bacterium]